MLGIVTMRRPYCFRSGFEDCNYLEDDGAKDLQLLWSAPPKSGASA